MAGKPERLKAGTARKPEKNWNEGSLLRQYICATKHPALIADADQIRSVNNETVWIWRIIFVCCTTLVYVRILVRQYIVLAQ